ncbi:hypothetical protein [Allorhodopirellula heiligendammensis]|uniref:ABC-2 family transporter protein n=1 Tax=Allorhodopirellula heiligendammensis TaxID=2714739 RepID=A0A5C6BWY2_9BACT|nr:hypothetical protein [Allorhodopirellula heiligendammensis]TWU16021.1 hypothetical protein Poly21_32260 [Allorhodopirellula heiligendammensis]
MNVALRHLVWKDARSIASLVAVILAGTLTFQLLLWALILMFGEQSNVNLAVPLWILMPNLMAIGAPPMLVGSEEESGTLGWLRTLPLPWPLIVVSKSLVAVAAVILSWLLSSLLLWMTVSMWDAQLPITVEPMLTGDGILALAFFSFQLLFAGFFLAYSCQSPILSLILVLPTMIGLMTAVDAMGRLLSVYPDPSGLWGAMRIMTIVAYVVALVAAQFLPACWRLAFHRSTRDLNPPSRRPSRRTQPYTSTVLLSAASRPGTWRALLWQAWRQQSRPLMGLSIIAGFCILRISTQTWNSPSVSDSFANFATAAMLTLTCTWMGCLGFYSDSISRRHFFFADRGFPTREVWCSRLVLPILAVTLATFGVFMVTNEDRSISGFCILGFACGVLSSMWMTRSALAFLISPALLVGILLATTALFEPYGQYFGYVAVAALPLLIASWRLMDVWLKHTQGWMTQLRVAGFVLLGILLVPVTFFTARYSMMPEPLPQWRTTMLAQPMPKAFGEISPNREPTVAQYLKPWLATHPLPIKVEGGLVDRANLLRQQTERALVSHRYDTQGMVDAARSAQRMLEWAKAARLALLKGEMNPANLLKYAGSDEQVAISQLYNLVMSDVHPVPSEAAAPIRDALNAMASEDLREESWRVALAMEWRLYQSRRGSKWLAGESVDVGYWFPRLEKIRADRNVDWAVHSLLDTPMPEVSDPHTWSADPRLYSHSNTPIDFDVGYGPKYKSDIEEELKRRGF